MLVRELISFGHIMLTKANITNPKLETRIILKHILHCDDSWIFMQLNEKIQSENVQIFKKLIKYRSELIPIAYILGKKEFYGRDFIIDSNVLIPRPDTEILIDGVLDNYRNTDAPLHVLELGTGSGALIMTLCLELHSIYATATDISNSAMNVAKQNATLFDVKNIKFILSDWFNDVPNKKYDLIISNPPYIDPLSQEIARETAQYEPHLALFAENNGLQAYQIIADKAGNYLNDNGRIYLEIGYDQSSKVKDIFEHNNFKHVQSYYDLNKIERCLVFSI